MAEFPHTVEQQNLALRELIGRIKAHCVCLDCQAVYDDADELLVLYGRPGGTAPQGVLDASSVVISGTAR